MALAFALAAAGFFGVADFTGGMAARRAPAITVLTAGNIIGLALVLIVVAVDGSPLPGAAAVAWGAGAGVAGGVGLAVLYHALATTRVSVAAPAAAVFGAAVPVVFGVALGERPSVVAWYGVVVAIPAIGLIARGPAAGRGSVRMALVLGAIAGVGFGLFGILISRTGDETGMWPLVFARVASILALSGVALSTRRPIVPTGRTLGLALGAGLLDMAANIFFVLALRRGLLSLVVIVQSMYPAVTIALATLILRERVTRTQLVGLGCGGVALVLIGLA